MICARKVTSFLPITTNTVSILGEHKIHTSPSSKSMSLIIKKMDLISAWALAAKTVDGALSPIRLFQTATNTSGILNTAVGGNNDSGGSMWEFYGKYMLMSQVMNWAGFGLSRNHYNDYSSFRGSGRPYYGPEAGIWNLWDGNKKTETGFFQKKNG